MYGMQTLHAGGIPMFRGTYLVDFVIDLLNPLFDPNSILNFWTPFVLGLMMFTLNFGEFLLLDT